MKKVKAKSSFKAGKQHFQAGHELTDDQVKSLEKQLPELEKSGLVSIESGNPISEGLEKLSGALHLDKKDKEEKESDKSGAPFQKPELKPSPDQPGNPSEAPEVDGKPHGKKK